jgi:hypothetical protein
MCRSEAIKKVATSMVPMQLSPGKARTNPNLSVEAERNGHMLGNLLDSVA